MATAHKDALASMTDTVVEVGRLRKVLPPDAVPTIAESDAWSSRNGKLNPTEAAKNKGKLATETALKLALRQGIAPLDKIAISAVAAFAFEWSDQCVKDWRDTVTAKKHQLRDKAITSTALTLAKTYSATAEELAALIAASTVAAHADSVRMVERWLAEDWSAARTGDGGDERPHVRPARSLAAAAQLDWLAQGRIPNAAVTLLVGDEGIGKSLYWTWLAKPVTTGKAVPEYGIPERDPGHLFIVATEDDWATSVLPRLDVAGADLDFVHVICTEEDGSGAPTFPRDIDVLATAEVTPALIVIDAWLDTVPSALQVRDPQQARQALHPWREYAASTRAAVLLLTHTNRVATANARDKYGITSELRKKARSTLYAQTDPDNADCVLIGPEKSNIAGQMPADRFRISAVQHFAPTNSSSGTVPRLDYVESVGKSSRELINAAFYGPEDDDDSDLSEAINWLEDYLGDHGRTPSKDVKTAARADGIKEHTIKRAASTMQKSHRVNYVSEGFPRVTYWEVVSGEAVDPYTAPSKASGEGAQ